MSVMNLNGTSRKNGIAHGATIKGQIFHGSKGDPSTRQHGTTRVTGTSYNSPFTRDNASLFTNQNNNSTQVQLPALKVETPGTVVPVNDFVKIHPHEKGTFFATHTANRPTDYRNGGPSSQANTPSNPNTPTLHKQTRPVRKPANLAPEKETHLSFLRSGGTLGGHPNSSSDISRWHTVKKGAVQ